MSSEVTEQTRFDNLTYRVETPDGTMFVAIMESNAGKPIGMHINIGKAGVPVAAWAQAFARIITLALNNGVSINQLIGELSNTSASSRPRVNADGMVARSGPEGVCIALYKYRATKFQELKETLNGPAEDDEDDNRVATRMAI